MSESPHTLTEITRHTKGRILLVGRKIGQEKFGVLKDVLRVEAKPSKYPTGKNPIPWESCLLRRFNEGDFESIVLHRFLYKPTRSYVEDPEEVLTEVKRILPEEGVLIVNSFLLDEKTKDFRSADCFYTEEEMMGLLRRQSFKDVNCVRVTDAMLFVCKK
jgi:hypothetical protein